jgi:hypothetical protein
VCKYLEGSDGSALEAEIGLEVLSNFTNESLEGELADQKLGGLLVTTDLTESDGTGAVTMGLLHTSGGGGRLAGSLGGELLPGGLASGRLTSGLLGTGHLAGWWFSFELSKNLNLSGTEKQFKLLTGQRPDDE